MQPLEGRPQIEYPCTWTYQVVAADVAALRAAMTQLLAEREHRVIEGQSSRTGKYTSLTLEVEVADQAERDRLFAALSAVAGVRFVV